MSDSSSLTGGVFFLLWLGFLGFTKSDRSLEVKIAILVPSIRGGGRFALYPGMIVPFSDVNIV